MDQSKPKRGASVSKEFVQRERRNHSVPSSSQDLHGIAYNITNISIKKIITNVSINWKSSMFSIFFQSFSTLFSNFNILDLLSYLYFAVSTFYRFDVLS